MNLFAEAEFGNDGGGIHIHIEDSVLNALLEKVPWAEVFDSLNNKLSRTEETKHIREHIYRVFNCQAFVLFYRNKIQLGYQSRANDKQG